jgi:hypothetical protein
MSQSPAVQHGGRRFKERTAYGGFAARRVPLQASPAPNSLKLNPKVDWLAHGHARDALSYYPFSSFRPSSLAELLCPLLTPAARSEWITPPSVPVPGRATDLP